MKPMPAIVFRFLLAGLLTAGPAGAAEDVKVAMVDGAGKTAARATTPEAAQPLASAVRKARPSLAAPVALAFVPGPPTPDALVCRAQACAMPIADAATLISVMEGEPAAAPAQSQGFVDVAPKSRSSSGRGRSGGRGRSSSSKSSWTFL